VPHKDDSKDKRDNYIQTTYIQEWFEPTEPYFHKEKFLAKIQQTNE